MRIQQRQRQRLDWQLGLTLDADGSTAGCHHLQRRTGRQQIGDKGRRFRKDVLAVVNQEKSLLGTQVGDERLRDRATWGHHRGKRRGDRLRHVPSRVQRGQIKKGRPISKVRSHLMHNRQRQAGLTHPAGAGQRQERDGLVEQEGSRESNLDLPTDERSAGSGQ
jgi:hypothetical protein